LFVKVFKIEKQKVANKKRKNRNKRNVRKKKEIKTKSALALPSGKQAIGSKKEERGDDGRKRIK
jgi:hypothetical protein